MYYHQLCVTIPGESPCLLPVASCHVRKQQITKNSFSHVRFIRIPVYRLFALPICHIARRHPFLRAARSAARARSSSTHFTAHAIYFYAARCLSDVCSVLFRALLYLSHSKIWNLPDQTKNHCQRRDNPGPCACRSRKNTTERE